MASYSSARNLGSLSVSSTLGVPQSAMTRRSSNTTAQSLAFYVDLLDI